MLLLLFASLTKNLALKAAQEMMDRWRSFLPENDRQFTTTVTETEEVSEVIDPEQLPMILSFMLAFPHGAHAYDGQFTGIGFLE